MSRDLNELPLTELFRALGCDVRTIEIAKACRDEDLGSPPLDVTSAAVRDANSTTVARVVVRGELVVAGSACLPLLADVFTDGRVGIHVLREDGAVTNRGATIAEFSGPLADILSLERTALNLLSRLSGVASMAFAFVKAVEGTTASIYDTRKTTPGLRVLEKYAARCGGAKCHRIGLYDALLIKDNHIAGISPSDLPRFVADAVVRARELAAQRGETLSFAELEVDTLEQFEAVLRQGGCGLDYVLLDNMSTDNLREAVAMRNRSGVRIELEASGGVRLETVRAIAETGVERISAGAITHQAVGVDLGLDIE